MPNKESTHAVFLGLKPFARLDCPQEVIRQFTPNWFAVTMGTGILAIALSQFPVPIPGLRLVAQGLWFLNMGLFSLFTCLYATRWLMFYNQAKRVFGHSVISMFFSCIPMGLATIYFKVHLEVLARMTLSG
jgi:tellurite resistance protein TehA-like permease